MSAHPQTQCAFVHRLPREIRNAIYLELWRSCGLRQHILWHSDEADRHFCRWPCAMEYEVQDELQRDIEELRSQLEVPLGQELRPDRHEKIRLYCRRLQSPWMNHWPCGERAEKEHGLAAIRSPSTATIICWRKNRESERNRPWSSAYIPMLLSCKLISAECLQSIYESTTFIFTDFPALQMFFGYCELHPVVKTWPKLGITPPAFFKYARSLELSLSPDFPKLLMCANFDLPGIERRHDVYDFHWLRLDQFQNLQRVNIWIAARSVSCRIDSDNNFFGIKQFGVEGLRGVLAPFGHIKSVTLSTPLGPSIRPQEGNVEGVAPPGFRLYKRGSGDRFHPFLNLIQPGPGYLNGVIFTSPSMEVRLAQNGGNHDLMEEV
ncbi:hypothetical protein DL769_009090 [Monosporascus sp. CRB-8-3]|nr:hypothetical protein DL769_009090 [Monosporascus sp. CRB-8-3]